MTQTPTSAATDRERPRIAVVGAGPGGLTCARILQRAGFAVTVYERDASPTARDQGGTLDMQTETGQVALRAAGLLEEFLARARPEGQDMTFLDKEATVLFARTTQPGELDAPEIDRAELRDLLLAAVDSGTVRWGTTLRSIRPLDRGQHELVFADGSSTVADLVVGADGAWSKVRPLVSDAVPFYEGVMFVEIRFHDVDQAHPAIAELVGRGGMFAMQDNQALIAQRQSGNRIRVYVAFRDERDWAQRAGVDLDRPAEVRRHLLDRFADWSPRLRQLLADCDEEFIERPIHAMPVPHEWKTRAGVTILGDAAHLMSPFSGLGANTAMLDAADLAAAVIASPEDLHGALVRYESTMLPRAARNAAGAHEGLQGAITGGRPSLDHLAGDD